MEENKDRKYAYWLDNIPGVGDKTIQYLLSVEDSPERIYKDFTDRSLKAEEHISEKYGRGKAMIQKIRTHACQWQPEREYESLEQKGIRFFSVKDDEYPWRLKMIPDPPFGLYAKGKLPKDHILSVAVIGARECSEYGRYVGTELGKSLGASGVQVISGMARGIDGISQRAALEAGGTSFGVLGCGVDVCYPAQNRELYEKLPVQGGILSANPPGTLPKASLFPPRNRIVSGLSDVVIVVEARQKSGTLITVDMALEQGREVYVVPGRLTDRLSDGCNKLMKQGAGILLSPEAFLQEMRETFQEKMPDAGKKVHTPVEIESEGTEPEEEKTDKDDIERQWEHEIYKQLDLTPLSTEQIRQAVGGKLSYMKLRQILMQLCLSGKIKQASPGFYSREKP